MIASWFPVFVLLSFPSVLVLGDSSASFDYTAGSAIGPENWGTLDIEDNECSGSKNSPIAVETSSCDVKEDYVFKTGDCTFADMTFTISNTGVKAEYGNCTLDTVQIPGVEGTYQALQFHVHTSSEHTIDGEFFGAELHIVHKQVDGDRYAVVGMMIEPKASENHATFENLIDGWKYDADKTLQACVAAATTTNTSVSSSRMGGRRRLEAFAAYDMVPEGATFYHYDGGLTTPPCSEVVWWNLADSPVEISVAQYNELTQLVLGYRDHSSCELATVASASGSTSRPTQPLNGRVVKRICPASYVEAVKSASTSGASYTHLASIFVAGIAMLGLQIL